MCLKNIRTFLKVCHDKFGLRNSELFDPFDLFDVRDFGKVSGSLGVGLKNSCTGWPVPTRCHRWEHAEDRCVWQGGVGGRILPLSQENHPSLNLGDVMKAGEGEEPEARQMQIQRPRRPRLISGFLVSISMVRYHQKYW